MRKLLAISLFVGLIGCASTTRYTDVAYKTFPSVVTVSVSRRINNEVRLYSLGAGVIVSSKGHIISAAHVVDFDDRAGVEVTTFMEPFAVYSAKLIGVDRNKDLALLKIEYPNRYSAKLARPGTTKIGEEVAAIGHPLGIKWTMTHGIISKFVHGEQVIQNDASISPGNSGGPLFNLDGELIGIITHIYTPSVFPVSVGLSMATSVESIRRFMKLYAGLEEVR